jgi:hypothetical protein
MSRTFFSWLVKKKINFFRRHAAFFPGMLNLVDKRKVRQKKMFVEEYHLNVYRSVFQPFLVRDSYQFLKIFGGTPVGLKMKICGTLCSK